MGYPSQSIVFWQMWKYVSASLISGKNKADEPGGRRKIQKMGEKEL